ncbi:MAG: TIGR04438 family Trp-rich protein [Burkholderiaceae bacterium]
MWFIAAGVVLVVLNLLGVGPIGEWTWNLTGDLWKFVLPFAFALGWWAWSDSSGLTKRREMERMDARKELRREKNMDALGLNSRARRKSKP